MVRSTTNARQIWLFRICIWRPWIISGPNLSRVRGVWHLRLIRMGSRKSVKLTWALCSTVHQRFPQIFQRKEPETITHSEVETASRYEGLRRTTASTESLIDNSLRNTPLDQLTLHDLSAIYLWTAERILQQSEQLCGHGDNHRSGLTSVKLLPRTGTKGQWAQKNKSLTEWVRVEEV